MGSLAHLEAERDVVAYGHVAKQGIVLEYEAHTALLHGQPGGILARQQHASRVSHFQSGDDSQDRALARSGGTQKGDELARADLERDILHGLKRAIALGEVSDFDPHVWLLACCLGR